MEKECLNCKNSFQTTRGIKKYCSERCRTSSKFKRLQRKHGSPILLKNKRINVRGEPYNNQELERIRAYKKQWNLKNRERLKIERKPYFENMRFGGNRQQALERDNFQCQDCGLNNEQHIVIYGKSLNVHHVDRDKKNNDLINLVTLCLKCHRLIHQSDIYE